MERDRKVEGEGERERKRMGQIQRESGEGRENKMGEVEKQYS